MSGSVKLSDQQYAIMQVLWELGPKSTRDVQQALCHENWALTTVGTVLSRLEKKNILSSETLGREKIFTPLIAQSDVKKSMVSGLVTNLFKGDPKALLAHLLQEGEIGKEDLSDIEDMLKKGDPK
ncbi:BlaI/MecI/CopY family transcriptional regulator [Temperatibacter marinus]|uniref:BlaI/MecI/CopY family transcriptional regulator n=1 Tax=Temperatibacter marinus TaxID=1456591 RepID=A0AA52H855_9PROT|nr:BlaI/MecI/CopY family transcriptional regulator [Temperatibacter marinus]WND01479.1 BlaI/MecI/CopY family transcriptional regulator [Temperatibacter marinus]